MSNITAGDFLLQNEFFRVGLTKDDYETIHAYADHHSGGLLVLWRPLGDGYHAKAHDSWGPGTPDEPGNIVVHVYNDEGDDEVVRYFDNGHDAIEAFLTATYSTVDPHVALEECAREYEAGAWDPADAADDLAGVMFHVRRLLNRLGQ